MGNERVGLMFAEGFMTKKKFAITALVIMCVIFMTGLILVFSAPSIGQNAGEAFVRRQNGSFFMEDRIAIIDNTARSYQLSGSLISIIGGFGIILSGYALYKVL